MARGVRKTNRQKLEEELSGVREAIEEHRKAMEALGAKRKELEAAIELEELKELSALLKEKSLSPGDVRRMVQEFQAREEGQEA